MIITLWWGYLLAHPATLFIWGALAAACVLALAAYLRLTSEQGAHHAKTSRPEPRSRAGRMTRAGRWALVAASRLPGAITRLPIRGDAQGREGGCAPQEPRPAPGAGLTGSLSPRPPAHEPLVVTDGPPAVSAPPPGPSWARKAIGRRIRALRTWWAFTRPRRQPSTEERQAMALLQQMRDEDTGGFLALPAPGVTVKIGAADVRAAGRTMQLGPAPCEPGPLDYQPAPPLASMLSDETIARGMAAVK